MSDEVSPATVLRAPAAEVPPVVDSAPALVECAAALAAGEGPIAVDAERAGSYRYTQRAYLLQFHRRGAGTWLVDPIAIADWAPLAEVLTGPEWVLHAASQDLPGLAEVGLAPASLFDTELAGRLLNLDRVGLSAMTEQFLGVALAKSHSAADWSRRPLPDAWLTYAALDVELLLELRDHLVAELAEAGRLDWAEQEFEFVRNTPPAGPQPGRWRRVKGLKARSPRALAVARELWRARDDLARAMDRTPSKILPDPVIAAAAAKPPTTYVEMMALPGMDKQPADRRGRWWAAIERALALPGADLPPGREPSDEPPNPRSWDRVSPALAIRYEQVRTALTEHCENLAIPRENLVAPRVVRDVVWRLGGGTEPVVEPADVAVVARELAAAGARTWQIELVAEVIAQGLVVAAQAPVEAKPTDE